MAAPPSAARPPFDSARAAAAALYRALDRGDVRAALATFDDGDDVIAVGPGADAVAVGRKALVAKASKIFALGTGVGPITRGKARVGAAPDSAGVFLDDVDSPGKAPLRIQILLTRSQAAGWRVRMFHAAVTLPDEDAAGAALAGRFPMAGWPHLPEPAVAPPALEAASRAWHKALADREPERFLALMTRPDVLGAGSAPHERATTWAEYAAQIRKLLKGRPPQPPVFGDTTGFVSGATGWSLNAYVIDVASAAGGRGAIPVRATAVLEGQGGEWKMRSFFASVPRPDP